MLFVEAVLSLKDEALVSSATMLLRQDRLAAVQRRKGSSGPTTSVGWFRKPELMSSHVRGSTRVHQNEPPSKSVKTVANSIPVLSVVLQRSQRGEVQRPVGCRLDRRVI